MRINHNLNALNTWNVSQKNLQATQKSIQKLSSGLRINTSSDDAAGLSISEKMRGQIRGLDQSSRNVQDGISMIQTAEGALNEVHSLLQRGRELSVQAANDTQTLEDKQMIQKEVEELKSEINRISSDTEFNGIKLLNRSGVSLTDLQTVQDNLQKGWLAASEDRVLSALGLTGTGQNIDIVLDSTIDGPSNIAALVQYSYTPGVAGPGSNLSLHIDMQDFTNATYPNGGTPLSYDRIIAHEMTHAVMAARVNVSTGMETWFMEGVAEAVHGADERLSSSLSSMNEQTLANRINGGWGQTSDDYSMAYAAVRYMDHLIASNGGSGVQDIISYMASNPTATLNDAVDVNVALGSIGINSLTDFKTQFTSNAAGGGVEYITNELVPRLGNADTGSLSGSDRATVENGGVPTGTTLNNDDVINEAPYGTLTTNPMTGFTEVWPVSLTPSDAKIKVHIGANQGQNMEVSLFNASSTALGLDNVDVSVDANSAISRFDSAIQTVSSYRATLGAQQNRLEHALSINQQTMENLTAAESRIRDTDIAKEMMNFTKLNILNQASQSMLAQANQQPQSVLQLLR